MRAITGGRLCFRLADTVHAGCRDDDEHLAEVSGVIAQVIPASRIRTDGAAATVAAILATVFDPDLDPDGRHALLLAGLLAAGIGQLGRDRTR